MLPRQRLTSGLRRRVIKPAGSAASSSASTSTTIGVPAVCRLKPVDKFLHGLDAQPGRGGDSVADLLSGQSAGVDRPVIALSGTMNPCGNPCRETLGA